MMLANDVGSFASAMWQISQRKLFEALFDLAIFVSAVPASLSNVERHSELQIQNLIAVGLSVSSYSSAQHCRHHRRADIR